MLVLSRHAGERIMIGDDIEIVVTRIGEEVVRLGIIAPKHLRILREELLDTEPSDGSDCRDSLTE